MPPLSLLSLASIVRERHKHVNVEIADFEAKNGELYPDYSHYDMIAISGTSVHMPHVGSLLVDIRRQNPDTFVVVGGPHATFCHEEMLEKQPAIDAVFRGEAEESFSLFVGEFRGRKSLPRIQGVSTRQYISDAFSTRIDDLDSLPMLAYDLVDLDKYQLSTHRKDLPLPFVSLMMSRGCPYACQYCQTPNMFGRTVRSFSPSRIANEIEHLVDHHKIRSVVFWDDTFTASEDRVTELCAKIGGLNLSWMCNTRPEHVNENLLNHMKAAGCKIIFYGVESAHAETLQFLRRKTTLDVVRSTFNITRKVGIKTVGTLMIGAPGDTWEKIQTNIEFLTSLEPNFLYASVYNVTPGANEFERAKSQGIIPESIDWFNRDTFDGPPFGLPVANENLTRPELAKAQKFAYAKFYGKGREDEYE